MANQNTMSFPGKGWQGKGFCAKPQGILGRACNSSARRDNGCLCDFHLNENKKVVEWVRKKSRL